MMWAPAGILGLVVITETVLAFPGRLQSADTWAGAGEQGAIDHLRLFLLRSLLSGSEGAQQDQFRYPDSHEDPVTPLPKFNIPSPGQENSLSLAGKRSHPGSDVRAALPPWQEFCRMLEMRNCKRFRRSLPDPATMHRMLREKEKVRK